MLSLILSLALQTPAATECRAVLPDKTVIVPCVCVVEKPKSKTTVCRTDPQFAPDGAQLIEVNK